MLNRAKRRRALCVAACVSVAWSAASAGAQESAPPAEPEAPYRDTFSRFYLGAGVGGHLVLTDWDMGELNEVSEPVTADSSFLGELRLGMDWSEAWGAELGFAFIPFGASTETNDGLDLAARARWTFAPGDWNPYAVFGAGAYVNFQPDPDSNDGTEFKPQVHVGIGVAPRLSEDFRGRLEARYQVSDALESSDLPVANLLALVAGVDWLSGTSPAPKPEPPPPPPKPSDRDGDGLLDPDDQCPDEPEDKDGFEDQDGCPDPDNDQDGILDVDDKCPNEAETVNGVDDADGCPDALPGFVPCASIQFNQTIQFARDEHAITSEDNATLDDIARTLKSRRDLLEVLITGHTDSRASEVYNLALSKKRAESVRKALVARGVSADRLKTEWKGESQPLTQGETEASMAKNRRVEFRVIKSDPNAKCPNPRKKP